MGNPNREARFTRAYQNPSVRVSAERIQAARDDAFVSKLVYFMTHSLLFMGAGTVAVRPVMETLHLPLANQEIFWGIVLGSGLIGGVVGWLRLHDRR